MRASGRYSGTNAYIDLDLNDQMQCTISAGSYPDGVFVRATAVISGQIHASGGDGNIPSPSADLQMSLSMGAATAGQGTYPQVTLSNSPLALTTQTNLEHQLVAPGTTYPAPVITNMSVIGHLLLASERRAARTPGVARAVARAFISPR